MTLVFLDTETTGLADDCDVWEIGLIVRTDRPEDVDDALGDMASHIDTEHCWRVRPDLFTAEPTGLRIGRYYERMGHVADRPVGYAYTVTCPDDGILYPEERHTDSTTVAARVARMLDGATIVGAVPDFDDRHLRRFLRSNGHAGTWHYHLVDVETLAAGALRMPPPWGFDKLLGEFGLTYDEADRHTALGDARMVRDLYDKVLGR
jgi:DNA polymerase III epsilon subunit-like protein